MASAASGGFIFPIFVREAMEHYGDYKGATDYLANGALMMTG